MSAPEKSNPIFDLENAIINIGGVAECLRALHLSPEMGEMAEPIAYLANRLREHYRIARDAHVAIVERAVDGGAK